MCLYRTWGHNEWRFILQFRCPSVLITDNISHNLNMNHKYIAVQYHCKLSQRQLHYSQWNASLLIYLLLNKSDDQLDATITIIDLQISSTCFGQFFAHHQECKTVTYSMWYNVLQIVDRQQSVGHYTTCCKSQSCVPDDGQRIARNMFG